MDREFKHLQRRSLSKRTISTMIAFAVPLVIGWYAGYDMRERAWPQAACALYSVGLAVIVWTFPGWSMGKRNGQ